MNTEPSRKKTAETEIYRSPFSTRWAGAKMLKIWGDQNKFGLWRRLWIALAESQRELGLEISGEAIRQLQDNVDNIDFEAAARYEKELRHDVMAHVHAYADQCPEARGIIHLGATSCFVADNSELILIKQSLEELIPAVAKICRQLSDFALRHRSLPCLAYTHYQPAQVTTVGKRACLWLQDMIVDLQSFRSLNENFTFRGVKGTTGTQASFLKLFEGDDGKVKELEKRVAGKMGFNKVYPVTGQTYPRKFDWQVLSAISGLAISIHKMATDIRLLAGMKELEEPFGQRQIGSSAMAYKRNPMRCERMCALSRFLINNVQNASFTAADQWLERTLDDSANRRLSLSEGFLGADSLTQLATNVTDGLVVHKGVIARRLRAELPFMATENILMEAVKAGGSRQELHEKIRVHSMQSSERIKEGDGENDLLDRLKNDGAFRMVRDRLDEIVQPDAFAGRAPEQVTEFIEDTVKPALKGVESENSDADLRV